jgi:putative PIN family toxin of toxin-antitoxin system
MNRPRVVFDSNIYISGLVFGGIPARLLVLAVEAAAFVLCVSRTVREEVRDTLREKFAWTEDDIVAGCEPLWEAAESVETTTALAIIAADPDDDRILECAVDGRAEIIVTGDDHLLSLNRSPQPPPIDRIRIMTPRQFLDALHS